MLLCFSLPVLNAQLWRNNESNCLTGSVLHIDFVTGVGPDVGTEALQSQRFSVLLISIQALTDGRAY